MRSRSRRLEVAPSDAVFFAVTNPLVVHHATGFFILEHSFERARWRDDKQRELVIESDIGELIVIRVNE